MISTYAVVQTDRIGTNVTVGEFAVIRKDVVLGDNAVIHAGVVIEEGVVIGPGTEIYPGCYIGKIPKGAGATARPLSFQPRLSIGRDCAVGPNAVIFYDVTIGDHTLVGDGVSLRENSRVGNRCIIGRHVTVNYNTTIGDDTKIMDHSWLAGNMRVGHHVFISGGVLTSNDNEMGQLGYSDKHVIGPVIMDGARIGAGAIILPNICIGENALVAAGAVVTKNVEPNEVVKGLPARPTRR